jgi:hypothetical protein
MIYVAFVFRHGTFVWREALSVCSTFTGVFRRVEAKLQRCESELYHFEIRDVVICFMFLTFLKV